MLDNEPLFSKRLLRDQIREATSSIAMAVSELSEEFVRSNSDDDIYKLLHPKYEVNPIVLHEDRQQRERRESARVQQFVNGREIGGETIRLRVAVPFEGHSGLWGFTPYSLAQLPPVWGLVQSTERDKGELVMYFERPLSMAAAINDDVAAMLVNARLIIAAQKADVEEYNRRLPLLLSNAIKERRAHVGQIDAVLKALKVTPREGMPSVRTVPLERKVPVVSSPKTVAQEPAGWGIKDESYETILGVLRHGGATFEEAPATFSKLGEEDLRHFLRAMLNGYFRGSAQGEAFRGAGKTDISIVHENRAAFVAECKVWSGPACVQETIDQLLSYTTWRDVKTAAVFFNLRAAGFTDLQTKLGDALTKHPRFVDTRTAPGGEWRIRVRHPHDDQKVIAVHVFMFNLSVP